MIHCSLYIKEFFWSYDQKYYTFFCITFFVFQQLKSQISQIDQNGYNAFCDETLHIKAITTIRAQFPNQINPLFIICRLFALIYNFEDNSP